MVADLSLVEENTRSQSKSLLMLFISENVEL
jgi:hypothetical protein